jgi:hypothetical protein
MSLVSLSNLSSAPTPVSPTSISSSTSTSRLLIPMSLHAQNKTSRSSAQEPTLPPPPTTSTHIPSTTPQSRKRTHAAASPENATASQPVPKRISIKYQRRELTRSIIATLPRDALETLLLDAALGNAGIMHEIITANSLKRADVPSPERTVHQPSQRQSPPLRQGAVAASERAVVGSGDRQSHEGADGARDGQSSTEDLETISTYEDIGPLQFHHITYRQFEARKAQILDILRRNSPRESPSPDQSGPLNGSPAGSDRARDSAASMRWS